MIETEVSSLFRELKSVLEEIKKEKDPDEKKYLEEYAEELRLNIQNLALNVEIDASSICNHMIKQALENALIYKITKKRDCNRLKKLAETNGFALRDFILSHYKLKRDSLDDPEQMDRYQPILKEMYFLEKNPNHRTQLYKDHEWLKNPNDIGETSIQNADIVYSQVRRKILDTNEFEDLISLYNNIALVECD